MGKLTVKGIQTLTKPGRYGDGEEKAQDSYLRGSFAGGSRVR